MGPLNVVMTRDHLSGSGLSPLMTAQPRPILSTPSAELVPTGPLLPPAPGSSASTPSAPSATQNGMISSTSSRMTTPLIPTTSSDYQPPFLTPTHLTYQINSTLVLLFH